jgi:D-methionine transport system substrate-binding protein
MKKYIVLGLAVAALALTGCGHNEDVIKVGAISGPESDLLQTAAQVDSQKYGLNVQVLEFSDYIQPNAALNDGDIQANVFQHQPYLDEQIKEHGYKLAVAGKTFVYPMGLYSKDYASIDAIPNGSRVAIPNDPTNEARALLLLEKSGLITLDSQDPVKTTPSNITDNPRDLEIVEMDAANIPRAYQEVALAAINTNYAFAIDLLPSQDAVFVEEKDSPYANLIVVREQDINAPWVKQLVAAYHSPQVVAKAQALFKDEAVAAF